MTKPNDTKQRLLDAGIKLAKKHGYTKVTRDAMAAEVGVSTPLVSFHFGSTVNMKRDIMRAAIKSEILEIVAQGLADGNPYARRAPPELKQKAALHLAR